MFLKMKLFSVVATITRLRSPNARPVQLFCQRGSDVFQPNRQKPLPLVSLPAQWDGMRFCEGSAFGEQMVPVLEAQGQFTSANLEVSICREGRNKTDHDDETRLDQCHMSHCPFMFRRPCSR